MFSWVREGFFSPAVPTFKDLQKYYSETLPNIIPTRDLTVNLSQLTGTVDPETQVTSTPLEQSHLKDVSNLSGAFDKKQSDCLATGNGDKFDTLSSMASNTDTSQRIRCGWIYNNSNFQNSQGALGTSTGPIKTTTKGTWMWNLHAAKQKYHTDICKQIQSCEDIDASQFKQRCGWCTTSGRAVPVAGGTVAYPLGNITSCSSENLIFSSSNCPKPPPVPQDATYVRTPAEVCSPLQNGAMPRDCMIQKVKLTGCSDKGSLYQALKGGSDNDYLTAIYNNRAYRVYQERAVIPLSATSIKTGKLSASDALNEFKRVQDQAASDANTGLKWAARDLCLNAGDIDKFDFCSELQDSTPGPFALSCLQSAFLRAGGQNSGKMYPTEQTISTWNSLGTWGAVLRRINSLKDSTKSGVRKTQQEAMLSFYGIQMAHAVSSSGGVPNVGFVRIEGTGYPSHLNMSQLVVYDDKGNNVSVRRPVQSSQLGWGTVASTGNDGDERPRGHPQQVHGMGSGKDFWQVQLDGPTTVSSVVVYNRADCCGDRLGLGFVIKLFSPQPNTVLLWTSDPLNSSQVQRILTPGGTHSPKTIPLAKLQEMWTKAGCTRQLTEGDVYWWRTTGSIEGIQNDMNAYGSLTKSCSGNNGQHEFCSPGKCKYNAETQKCINAVEQTGFIPRLTWGTTPPSQHNYKCDDLLCPYFKDKHGSYDNVPAPYRQEAEYCKSRGL